VAITASTKTTDFSGFLHADQAGAIFDLAYKTSAVQQLAARVPLGIAGTEIPVVSGKPTASWVAEGGQKPASNGSMTLKTITPKKIAAIAVVSAEVVRANPGNYMNVLKPQIAEAFATAFDAAALHGTSTPFGAYLDQATKAVTIGSTTAANGGTYKDIVAGIQLLTNAGKRSTGIALDTRLEPDLLLSLDTTGRPLWVPAPYDATVAPNGSGSNLSLARAGSLVGRPAYMGDTVGAVTPGTGVTYALGYVGDWSQVVWGQIGGITYDVSTEATVTINGALTSLWEYNLVAIRAETEYGLLINDLNAFTKYTKTVP
jgi:HK97 family phage major capsid protein